jgi:two-component system phosphate regulon response regulator PhoB
MARPRILVVEDEPALAELVAYNLRREGYDVAVSHDGRDGLAKVQAAPPDVVVLDLMLPGLDGLDVCREVRAGDRTKHVPILVLTAKAEETDQVVGFSLGADDYVTKPFSVKVLVQRVKALLRRGRGAADDADVVEHGGLRIDRTAHKAFLDGRELDLTPTEFRLLDCLARRPGRAFTRARLMDGAMGDAIVLERTIDVHVKTLRRKLGRPELIETVRGVGYRFSDRPDGA